jgi:hypothetical protein
MSDETRSQRRSAARRRQGLPPNQIRPTDRQIATNLVVIPKSFLDMNSRLHQAPFAVMFLGESLSLRKLDSEHRVSLPLKGRILSGAVLALSVDSHTLHVNLA